jgi:uncharacterized protein
MIHLFSERLSQKLNLSKKHIFNVLSLLEDGATIPFIARYRKEISGNMDEIQINEIDIQYKKLLETEKRKEFILKSIEEQGKLTPELKNKIVNSFDPEFIEDLYLPFKRSNKTRAAIAREKGLEPLAQYIFDQKHGDIWYFAGSFTGDEVPDNESAINGALDIIAEWISENPDVRNIVRNEFENNAILRSKVVKAKKEVAQKYQDYFDYDEKLRDIPSHRLLAVFRAENEKLIRVGFAVDDERILNSIKRIIINRNSPVYELLETAITDSCKRLIFPAMENHARSLYKTKADKEAIEVFEKNLRQLLLASPVGQKSTLAIDPGFRTGCKVVCLSDNGELICDDVIYPHPPVSKIAEAVAILTDLIEQYAIEVIAVGDGTAGRETMQWIRTLDFGRQISLYFVNEDGASIYSASGVAREEFPDRDLTVRGAVSIGRRLMDPLAELVKIDPKSIGVGQYQHDVDQKMLREKLERTVESAVNTVGVNLNTASSHLLAYVSGLGPATAKKIVQFRSKNGSFRNKSEIKDVPGIGEKAFQQSAGFLRIRQGDNFLDNTGIHPESYHIALKIIDDLGIDQAELRTSSNRFRSVKPDNYITDDAGLPTVNDILKELEKPGFDPRGEQKEIEFDQMVNAIEDLKEGMILNGVVTNITNFGAFINIGIKEKGLVHISEMADKFIKDPNAVVSLNQQVRVKVINVDAERSRIQLSMRNL